MISYIRADLWRIFRRIPRLIVIVLLYALTTLVFVQLFRHEMELSPLMIAYEHYVVGFIPLVFGLVEMAAIYADDFRAKTMQAAIGRGMSRIKVVLCKLADMAILMFLDVAFFGVILLASGAIWKMGMGVLAGELLLSLLSAWFKTVAYTSLAMALAFYTQNALFALLTYIALSSGIAAKAVSALLGLKALAPLHLERFLLTNQANVLYTQMLLGRVDPGALLTVLLYIAAGIALTAYLFSGVELEL